MSSHNIMLMDVLSLDCTRVPHTDKTELL